MTAEELKRIGVVQCNFALLTARLYIDQVRAAEERIEGQRRLLEPQKRSAEQYLSDAVGFASR